VRCHNEDSYLIDPEHGLFAIADGMGGHQAGEVASAVAIESIGAQVRLGQIIDDAILKAHHAVVHASRNGRGKPGMGATAVAMQLNARGYRIAWVGDSRAYLWDGKLRQLTRDQTYVQKLLDEGLVTKEEARIHPERNIITQALGFEDLNDLIVENVSGLLYRGEKILLCSDGLTSELNDHQITHILASSDTNQQAIDNLIEAANANGGQDNITALLISAACGAPVRPRKGDTIRMVLPQWQKAIINSTRFKCFISVALFILFFVISIAVSKCSAEEIASPILAHRYSAVGPPHLDILYDSRQRVWASAFSHFVGVSPPQKHQVPVFPGTIDCRGDRL
jgi:protein phosphatase